MSGGRMDYVFWKIRESARHRTKGAEDEVSAK